MSVIAIECNQTDSRWIRFRRCLEGYGQMDLFTERTGDSRSRALRDFDARLEAAGVQFDEWVEDCIKAEMSLREMASRFGLLHGTLYRWIRRRMPGIKLKEDVELPTEAEYLRIIKVWREDEVTATAEIAVIADVSADKVKAARRRYHRKSKAAAKRMLSVRLVQHKTAGLRRGRWARHRR